MVLAFEEGLILYEMLDHFLYICPHDLGYNESSFLQSPQSPKNAKTGI